MSVKLSPVFNEQVLTSAGAPASGWSIYTYAAGSTTAQTTYTDSTGTVPQSNPIVLNALGYADNPIWLTAGQSYKFVLKDSQGVTQKTIDNVSGVNDTSVSTSQWISSGVTPTYVSASQFTLVGDQTTEFHLGRRLQLTVTAGTVYGVITASAYTTLTTVTVALDSGSLDSGLSAVNLSILRADHPSLPKSSAVLASIGAVNVAGDTLTGALNAASTVTVASATTTDIGAAASNSVIISGTTTITGLGTIAAGAVRDVTFSGSLTLTHNSTSLILPGSANISTAAGDTATFLSLGSGNWRCISYQKASGLPVAGVFGAGQTRQDLTASRTNGTTYTNSTGRPILVSVRGTAGGIASFIATVGSFTGATATAGSAGTQMSVEFLVMSGETYKVDITNVGSVQWLEVR